MRIYNQQIVKFDFLAETLCSLTIYVSMEDQRSQKRGANQRFMISTKE